MLYDEYHSVALVDYSGLGKTINDLRGSFSLLEFLDLCAILEGVVLHDRLIVVQEHNAPERWQDLLKPLYEGGVILPEPTETPAIAPGPRPERFQDQRQYNSAALSMRQRGHPFQKSTLLDSWYETGRLLGAEREYGCSPLPLIRQRPFYEKYGQTYERHTVCNLFGRYRELAEALASIRSESRLTLVPYTVVPIPPIPLLVLQLCRSYDDVLPRVLDIREDYTKLRTSLCGLREELADESVPPMKKLKAIRSWRRSWATLEEYDQKAGMLEIADNALDIPDLNNAIDSIGLDVVRLDKLLQVALAASRRAFHKWRIRLLHKAAKNYLRTPDSDLNNQIYRLFGRRIHPNELAELEVNWRRPLPEKGAI